MIIKKNNFRKILVAFCIGTFLCTGCHNKQNITQLESYDGKEQVSEAKEEKDILASKKKIQNIVSDKGSGNEKTFLFSLSYDITKKDTIYPCMEIIRAEKVTPEYVLKTIITVDNRYTDKESNSLLQEISAAYGINPQN